ncbi:MAG: dihydrolipoyl dehydrogenase [Clostridiales bacterium]|nr:dihydrolipoyl dehydrogenase [Clostridiales bacterium]
MSDYQLIVIGAGPGGYTAALRAAKLGLHTAIVERREVGGTCLNRGCIPTKTLLHASQVYSDAAEGARMGVHAGNISYDMGEIFAYKRGVSDKLRQGIHALLKGAKVDVVEGTAQITAPGEVTVTAPDGAAVQYTAERILAATGSVNVRPPIPGLELPGVMTSDELLEGTDKPYESLVIIGGGVIGVEFATFYSNLGCRVTLVEGMANLLPMMDRELGQNLAQILKKKGVEVLTSAMVQSLEPAEGGLCVHLRQKDKDVAVTGEKVLCAIGRRAYFDGLFAPEMMPALNGKRLLVDENYQTSIPGVYAIGDASSAVQLAHVAAAQGTDCVERMCGSKGTTDLRVIPSCIYSAPEIAVVGLTEAEAKEQGIPAVSGKCTLFSNARTIIEDPGRCFMKLVGRTDTREVIGAQLMCQHASDMISQISTAMVNHLTAEQLLSVMRPHPSFEEAMAEAVENLISKL